MVAEFAVPGVVATGAGAFAALPDHARRHGVRRVLIVTDPFFADNGLADRAVALLAAAGATAAVFAGVRPDPTTANVADGVAALRAHGADALVALGGGSPMDCAKAIAVQAANPGPLRRYMGGREPISRPGVPVIAVPTTAGTGSEATNVAVITDPDRDEKMMLKDRFLLPAVALVDPELSAGMPPALTAHVGVDTLTHGIEAFVSRRAAPLTDPLALGCVALVARHLETAFFEPGNMAARAGMAAAATQGGIAFSNSSVALIHGMSRPIGAVFHVPHGLSNAVLLPAVTRFSLPGAVARYAEIARTMRLTGPGASDEAACLALVAGLETLNTRLGIPRLRDCPGVTRARFGEMVGKMAADALASGSPAHNPVVPTAGDIVGLYEAAW